MDIFYEKAKNKKTLHKLNACRIKLKVITVSDITSLDGTVVLPEILQGINHRGSELDWPRKDVPEEWWSTWSIYVRSYIMPMVQQQKVGKMKFETHQKIKWRMYEGDILKYENKTFKRKESRSSQYIKYVLIDEVEVCGKGSLVDVQKVTPIQVAVRSNAIKCPISKATKDTLILMPTQVLWNKLIDKKKKHRKKN